MRERPIVMTPENAQKCHEGTKTQTRRILRIQPWEGIGRIEGPAFYSPTKVDQKTGEEYPGEEVFGAYDADGQWGCPCPFGRPGDRLWVRENGWERPERTPKMMRDGADTWERFYYDALLDSGERDELKGYGFKRRPSIHMPRWACRTVLEITDVRVERLQAISEADALAEGVLVHPDAETGARMEYFALWESLHGVGSWGKNPWVWVLTFREVATCGI